MSRIEHLLKNNQDWAKSVTDKDPSFFKRLSKQQSPKYFWIGCSDSRVPATQVTGLDPGEIFVHRNVANLVVKDDLNLLSALQFAVEELGVTDIIVCGHYGCGGIETVLSGRKMGLLDNWLENIKPETNNSDRLCELNVIQQVKNLSQTDVVQNAWKQSKDLTIHGWIYGLKDGLIKDLNTDISSAN